MMPHEDWSQVSSSTASSWRLSGLGVGAVWGYFCSQTPVERAVLLLQCPLPLAADSFFQRFLERENLSDGEGVILSEMSMYQLVILAGGKGTRMGSDFPKVLHLVKEVPLIERILENIKPLIVKPVVVVGYGAEEVKALLGDRVTYAYQREQLGTGHALLSAREILEEMGCTQILVTPGDHPLISEKTFRALLDIQATTGAKVALASVSVPYFDGSFGSFDHFGRIVRNATGAVEKIVEYKDATEAERAIREVNTSYYCFDAKWLWENIDRLQNNNASHEFYLTDMVHLAREDGHTIGTLSIEDPIEGLGINTPEQLALVEAHIL